MATRFHFSSLEIKSNTAVGEQRGSRFAVTPPLGLMLFFILPEVSAHPVISVFLLANNPMLPFPADGSECWAAVQFTSTLLLSVKYSFFNLHFPPDLTKPQADVSFLP